MGMGNQTKPLHKKLIILSAPSGAGKTTLCARLLAETPELVLSISTTSRPPRGKETHGKEYFFVTPAEFEARIKAGAFAEWANVHGNFYGTAKETLERSFKDGKAVLLDIDVQGAQSLRHAYPKEAYSVFIHPPSLQVLEARLRGRGTDSEATIQRRLSNAREELAQASRFDLELINDDLQKCYAALRSAVRNAMFGEKA